MRKLGNFDVPLSSETVYRTEKLRRPRKLPGLCSTAWSKQYLSRLSAECSPGLKKGVCLTVLNFGWVLGANNA